MAQKDWIQSSLNLRVYTRKQTPEHISIIMTIQHVHFYISHLLLPSLKTIDAYIKNINALKFRKLVTHFHASTYFKFLIDF